MLITGLNENYTRGTFNIIYTQTDKMLSNFNTKPLGVDTLQDPVLWTVGHRYYPMTTDNKVHFEQLQLNKYPIGVIYD